MNYTKQQTERLNWSDESNDGKKVLIIHNGSEGLRDIYNFDPSLDTTVLRIVHLGKIVAITTEGLPDLIIIDSGTRNTSEKEIVKALHESREVRHIPIIIVSEMRKDLMEWSSTTIGGVVDFIFTPCRVEEVRMRVMSALNYTRYNEIIKSKYDHVRRQNRELKMRLMEEREQMQEALDTKKRELSAATILAHQKDELLNEVLDTIKTLKEKHNGATYPELSIVATRLRSYVQLDKSWQRLKQHFEQVHPHFFSQLKRDFESLSPNERKLCAYLKIGLGNKDIAQLNSVADATVRKAVNRIKKKLDLGAQESIRDFMLDYG